MKEPKHLIRYAELSDAEKELFNTGVDWCRRNNRLRMCTILTTALAISIVLDPLTRLVIGLRTNSKSEG